MGGYAMSVMIVPAELYRALLLEQYACNRNAGMEPATAMQRAQEMMDGAFVSEDAVLDKEIETLEGESWAFG